MEKDLTKKSCLSDNVRYADLINGLIFRGKQLVHAEDLSELDTQTGMWGRFLSGGKKLHQKYRDLIRKTAIGLNFVVIGIENQEEVHYLMPLRNMSYDVSEYERQAAMIRKKVRKQKGISKAEFVSGFTKDSKLYPCITLVLYYGLDWDGSCDLHGILDMTDIPEEVKEYINNYTIRVIEIRKLENTNIFQTDLKQIFDFIRFSDDKVKLRELVQNEPAYQEMDEEAYDMAVTYTDAKELIDVKKYHGKDGKVNMCRALTEMLQDERAEGRTEGRAENIRNIVKNMLQRGMSDEDIIAIAECEQNVIDEVRKRL